MCFIGMHVVRSSHNYACQLTTFTFQGENPCRYPVNSLSARSNVLGCSRSIFGNQNGYRMVVPSSVSTVNTLLVHTDSWSIATTMPARSRRSKTSIAQKLSLTNGKAWASFPRIYNGKHLLIS